MAARKKNEQPEIEWRQDTPERPGLYDCRVNGERTTLQYKRCIFTKRSYWLYVDGSDVSLDAKVEWHEGKVFTD